MDGVKEVALENVRLVGLGIIARKQRDSFGCPAIMQASSVRIRRPSGRSAAQSWPPGVQSGPRPVAALEPHLDLLRLPDRFTSAPSLLALSL